ncbi:hypothetical protein CLU83_3336 [Flavobacterium sp. 1]|uniref:Ig-like domain-containing protein n=1 Tax=Flavobacterium sp. 1 TaxID=2035200 RepID=UPI000C248521|nr:hypothetical protein [Flavobacterium sp. 1]PJJ09953.1 hypothetical protein CLU83_3336 [Flavobacterium sp. 1]
MKIILPKSKNLAVFLFFVVFLYGNTVFGQTTGDYRSIATGNWTTLSSWEYYNGTGWVVATSYPGQNTGTGTVTIRDTYNITLNTSISNSFTSLVIGNGASGKLIVSGDFTVNTKSVIINSNGIMSFIGNKSITFPANTSFVVNGSGKLMSESGSCSNNTALFIGTDKISACNGSGGGALSDFNTFNARGGTGSATSNTPVCTGSQLILTATAPVATSGSYTYTYKWSGSGIYNPAFSSSAAYTINNVDVYNHGGMYSVDIKRNDGIVSTVTTDVVINPTPTNYGVYGGGPICFNSSTPNLTTSGVGTVVRWEKKLDNGTYSAIPGTAGLTSFSENPSAAGTWTYQVVMGSGACPVVYSNPTASVIVNPELTISLVSTNSPACQNASNSTLSYTATTGNASAVKIDFDAAANTAGVQDINYSAVSSGSGTITIQYAWGIAPGTYNGVLTVIKDYPVCSSSTTYPVTLTIYSSSTPTSITAQPSTATQTICLNGTASAISVTATGASLTYQWYSNSTASNSGGTLISGATSSSYTPLTTAAGTKYYYCVVTGGCGSSAISAVSGAILINGLPAISSQVTPAQTICLNGTATAMLVMATGAGLGYQWYSNATASNSGGTSIGSATLSSYTPPTTTAGTTYYYCVVSGTCAPLVTSSVSGAILINPAPTLTSASQIIFSCDNSPATIKLTGLLSGSTSRVDYTINGVAQTPITGLTEVAGEATFDTRILSSTDNGKTLQITGITTTSASPSCPKSFAIDVILNVKPDSGGISLNGGTAIASGGTTTFSEKTSATFSIVAIPGATSYTWFVPGGWSITAGGGTNQITVTTGTEFQSGNVTVTANNMFCPSSLGVTLTSIAPPAPTPDLVIPVKCNTKGSISFNNLPAGSWTLNVTKDGVGSTISGSGNIFTLSNLTGGNYTFTVTDAFGTSVSSAIVNVDIVTKTWNGSGWFKDSVASVAPTSDENVEFAAGSYVTSAAIDACSCTVKNGASVKIDVGGVLNIVEGLTVETGGTLIFENNASLIQTNDNAVNIGSITYKRSTPLLQDLDYEYWSSPVAGQTLGALYTSDRYFRYTNGAWVAQTSGTTMDIGRGYIIRYRTAVPSKQSVEFNGVPNNGIRTITAQGANRSNLIGNPYPSAIDAEAFILDPANSIITGALYFWTHFSARRLDGTTYKYDADDYAAFSLTGSIGTAPSIQNAINNGTIPPSATIIPSGKIAAGQSFFVINDNDGDFTFNNSMRFDYENGDVNNNSQFFKPSSTKKRAKIEKDRIWLNLNNDEGAFKQLLVGYITGATNDFDKLYDGVTRNGNAYVDFYSVNNSKNYTIQGRGLPFDKADEVPLGYKSTIAGTFQIGIDNVDGSMVNQAIYLEDKQTNTIHDLKAGSYSFATEIGVFNDRFVLRYMNNTSKLGTGDVETKGKGVFVSVRNREIKINSFDQTMSSVKVYDLKGSLLYEKNKVDKNEFIIDTLNASNQFMIVMVQLEDGKWISEEIIFHD